VVFAFFGRPSSGLGRAYTRSFVGVSVCNVRVPRVNGSTDRDDIWHTYSYGPKTHCVKLTQCPHAYVCQTARWVLVTRMERGRQGPYKFFRTFSSDQTTAWKEMQLACW